MSPTPLHIGGLLFEQVEQLDFTGPFEVLSRLPGAVFYAVAKTKTPIRDAKGLILTPEYTLNEVPQLDVLVVPGGVGVNTVMEDEAVLEFTRRQAAGARIVLSVCTGALICGAAGLLHGRKATTHWASHHLLKELGARAVKERVVMDGNLVSAAGVTSGIDGALAVAALLCGDEVGQRLQLYLEYSPEPPFASGSPETAPEDVLKVLQAEIGPVVAERAEIIRRVMARPRG
jgi:cyclohexyl-isocyanide hydratase